MKKKNWVRKINLLKFAPWIIWGIYFSLISLLLRSNFYQRDVDYRDYDFEKPTVGEVIDPMPYLITSFLFTPPIESNQNWFSVQATKIFLHLPPEFENQVDTLCIENINIKFRIYSNQFHSISRGSEVKLGGIESPFCTELSKSDYHFTKNQSDTVYDSFAIKMDNPSISARLFPNPFGFYYPFDGFHIDIGSIVSYSLLENGIEVFSRTNYLEQVDLSDSTPISINPTHFQDWDITLLSNLDLSNEESWWAEFWGNSMDDINSTVTSIDYKRPLYYQLLIPPTLAIIAVIIFLLTKLNTVDTLIQGVIAVVVGLLGLKVLIVPPNSVAYGILDTTLICLYLELFAVVFIFITRKKQSINPAHNLFSKSRQRISRGIMKKRRSITKQIRRHL